jgi:hypothetical protein
MWAMAFDIMTLSITNNFTHTLTLVAGCCNSGCSNMLSVMLKLTIKSITMLCFIMLSVIAQFNDRL